MKRERTGGTVTAACRSEHNVGHIDDGFGPSRTEVSLDASEESPERVDAQAEAPSGFSYAHRIGHRTGGGVPLLDPYPADGIACRTEQHVERLIHRLHC